MTKSGDYVDYIYKTFYETIYRRECICGVMQKRKCRAEASHSAAAEK